MLLADASAALERATGDAVPADYEALSAVLDVATERLARAWGAVGHLNGVADTPALRAAYTETLPKVTEFHTRLGADDRLYAKYKAIAAQPAAPTLPPARRKALTTRCATSCCRAPNWRATAKRTLRADPGPPGRRWRRSSPSTCSTRPTAIRYYASADELAGVPADVMAGDARRRRGRRPADGHKLTLHVPELHAGACSTPTDRALRETLYTAYVTRASEFGPAELDNAAVMRELLELRHEEAQLLGYANFAELSLVPKMADSPERGGRLPARPGAARAAERRARPGRAARVRRAPSSALAELQSWDMSPRQRTTEGAPLRVQRPGGQAVLHRAQGARGPVQHRRDAVRGDDPRPTRAPVWHPTGALLPHRAPNGRRLVGQFYLDPYARAGKRPGAWMDDVRDRWVRPEGGCRRRWRTWSATSPPPVDGQPGAADARRRDDAVPRVRPRPAPHADAGRRPRRVGHLRRRVGRGRAAEPVHGELLLGVGGRCGA